MIHVCICTSDIGYMVLGNECILLAGGGVLSERQPPRWKHAFYSMFSSGSIPMGYALYISLGFVQLLPLICGRLLADLDSSDVLIVIIYSDTRQEYNGFFYIMINIWDFHFILATAKPRPTHEVGNASKPTLSMGFPIKGRAGLFEVGGGGAGRGRGGNGRRGRVNSCI